MRCSDARVGLSAYVDRELGGEALNELTSHLGQCLNCRETLEGLQRSDEQLMRLTRVDPGADFFRRLLAIVDEEQNLDRAALTAARPGVLDELRNVFGLAAQSSNNPLDEFGDCPPLSIGSAYFTIFGQPGRP